MMLVVLFFSNSNINQHASSSFGVVFVDAFVAVPTETTTTNTAGISRVPLWISISSNRRNINININDNNSNNQRQQESIFQLQAMPDPSLWSSLIAAAADEVASSAVAAESSPESWRQYVPLGVSLCVITDILLGSPAANSVLGVIQSQADEKANGGGSSDDETGTPLEMLQRAAAGKPNRSNLYKRDPNERVDTAAVAQKALDKAAMTSELRRYLDEKKSDMDKIQEIQKELDQSMADFDVKSQKARKNLNDQFPKK